jgi:hypothetical protein
VSAVKQPIKPFTIPRRWITFLALVTLLIAYVAPYVHISRLRRNQYEPLRMLGGFLYEPPESLSNDPEERWRIKHELWSIFFSPLNKIDREFGGPSHNVCIMMGIGPKKR